ncbi:MAG: hypothetical protein QGI33_01085 [Candidatus Brocadiia bacterium]|jgi:hypothetical protein|nr:hypothetical protein [Candidatus Brocadiia bacterium]
MDYDAAMLNIGHEKQVFVDDLVVEVAENVCRTWHPPVRAGEEPVLRKDQPWEHIPYFSCNIWQVIHDPKDGLFNCWYVDWDKPDVRPGVTATVVGRAAGSNRTGTCSPTRRALSRPAEAAVR